MKLIIWQDHDEEDGTVIWTARVPELRITAVAPSMNEAYTRAIEAAADAVTGSLTLELEVPPQPSTLNPTRQRADKHDTGGPDSGVTAMLVTATN